MLRSRVNPHCLSLDILIVTEINEKNNLFLGLLLKIQNRNQNLLFLNRIRKLINSMIKKSILNIEKKKILFK
jgi:hypothetical protein